MSTDRVDLVPPHRYHDSTPRQPQADPNRFSDTGDATREAFLNDNDNDHALCSWDAILRSGVTMDDELPVKKSKSSLQLTRVEDATAVEKYLPSLRSLLQVCVNDEPAQSSIGFLYPLSAHTAIEYWLQLFPTVIGPNATTTLLVATDPSSEDPDAVVATVQVTRMPKETHGYKGEIRKLLVHPANREGGVGRWLMDEIEAIARDELGLDMLVLDTATETPARIFYQKTGWHEWGVCPQYAKNAVGMKHDCSFFIKMLQ